MKLSARATVLSAATLSGLLLLSACGKKDDQQSAAPTAASTAAQPAAAPAASAPAPASTAATAPASAGTAATAPSASPATAMTAAPAADGLKVGTLALSNAVGADHKVGKAKTSFSSTDKALFASVSTTGHSSGATLSAKWSYLEGQGVTVADTSQSIAPDGPAVTTFTVHNPNEWPEGKYKVEISLDNKLVGSQNFEIKKR